MLLFLVLSAVLTTHVMVMQVLTNQAPPEDQVGRFTVVRNAVAGVAKCVAALVAAGSWRASDSPPPGSYSPSSWARPGSVGGSWDATGRWRNWSVPPKTTFIDYVRRRRWDLIRPDAPRPPTKSWPCWVSTTPR
ncbi:hypothetical protein ACFQ3Z_44160 [Streptomyces nogalater]